MLSAFLLGKDPGVNVAVDAQISAHEGSSADHGFSDGAARIMSQQASFAAKFSVAAKASNATTASLSELCQAAYMKHMNSPYENQRMIVTSQKWTCDVAKQRHAQAKQSIMCISQRLVQSHCRMQF